MVDDHNGGDKDIPTPTDREYNSHIDRRSCLKLGGATAASLAALGTIGRASAATSRRGLSFNRVVNVVDDLGVDPSGGRVDDSIAQHAEDGMLLVFPEGRYRFEQPQSVSSDNGVVGFLGQGDVRFVPPQGINDSVLSIDAREVLVENINVDQTADNTTAGLKIHSQSGFHVENVEFIGRGLHEDRRTTNYVSVSVSDPDATGVLKNLVVKKGDAWSHYRGATGIWVGRRHRGTVKMVDCHIEECGGDGIYASRNHGQVQIEGGVFRNNNVCSVRISGDGSYVDGAVVEVNPQKYTGPHTQEDREFQLRGIVVEQWTSVPSLTKPQGAQVRNCDVNIKENPTSGAGIAAWSSGKTLTVKNTRVQMDNDAPAILREGQRNQGSNPPSRNPRWLRMDTCTITGSATGGATILVEDADGSEITNCYIKQTEANRDGIRFVGSNDTLVRDSIINVAGRAIDFNSSSGKKIGIDHSGSPPTNDRGTPQSGTDQTGSSQSTDTDASAKDTNDPSHESSTDSKKQETHKTDNSWGCQRKGK